MESILGSAEYSSYEIVISANGDRTTDYSFPDRLHGPTPVRLLRTEEYLGVGRARNIVVEPRDAEFYIFLYGCSSIRRMIRSSGERWGSAMSR